MHHQEPAVGRTRAEGVRGRDDKVRKSIAERGTRDEGWRRSEGKCRDRSLRRANAGRKENPRVEIREEKRDVGGGVGRVGGFRRVDAAGFASDSFYLLASLVALPKAILFSLAAALIPSWCRRTAPATVFSLALREGFFSSFILIFVEGSAEGCSTTPAEGKELLAEEGIGGAKGGGAKGGKTSGISLHRILSLSRLPSSTWPYIPCTHLDRHQRSFGPVPTSLYRCCVAVSLSILYPHPGPRSIYATPPRFTRAT